MSIKSHIAANKYPLTLSVLFGLAAGALVMYLAWQHNPQCEIHCDGGVYWSFWFMLGLSAFTPVFLVVICLVWVIKYVKNT
ncbi:MAG: hypothetical protein FHK82_18200 [Sedimenticola thiotaurini]|uniref:Transmembrane protein n=1 Tax=Sedimenticola thiotaurini TaxID=1543721 RepID=A0A558CEB4_9GAMM|nr:MAG: hypothetical protein FHK82_18200 [Sedimenticola thiotaurini]